MNEGLQDDTKFTEFLQKLNKLDFGPLAYKLMHPEDRPGLSFEQSLDAIKKYKGFLFLCFANQGKSLSPSRYIDYVWHAHMADTELYMVQTVMLFGHFLHHFPFFGKRGQADEADLLAAADFTARQAALHFGWEVDDWCGTGRNPGPRLAGLTELFGAIVPAGPDASGLNWDPDSVTIQAGNFRHTIEHLAFEPGLSTKSSRQRALEKILKLPPWVTICKPAELGRLNEIFAVRNVDRLDEISMGLVQNRLAPDGFSSASVELRVGAQAQRITQ